MQSGRAEGHLMLLFVSFIVFLLLLSCLMQYVYIYGLFNDASSASRLYSVRW
jgi:hypothetical protein